MDRGEPISPWGVAREMGHAGVDLIDQRYGHRGEVRHRSEVVEYRAEQHREVASSSITSGTLSIGRGWLLHGHLRHHHAFHEDAQPRDMTVQFGTRSLNSSKSRQSDPTRDQGVVSRLYFLRIALSWSCGSAHERV
jgi:hypothetical protein